MTARTADSIQPEEELRRLNEELRRNYDVQSAINKLLRLSLEDVPTERILEEALSLVLSIPWLSVESRGGILLAEEDSAMLVMKAQRGLAEPIQKACARFPFGRCLCGRAAVEQRIVYADRIGASHETKYEGMGHHGHYCVPITFGGKTLGVICVYLKEGHVRDALEEEFLGAIANTLAGIIARRQAEGQLRASEQRYRSLFERNLAGVFRITVDGRILECNTAFARIYGYGSPDELQSHNAAELWANESDWQRVMDILRSEGIAVNIEVQGRRADGRMIWVLTNASLVAPDPPADPYVEGTIVDITERRNLEEKLRHAQRVEAIGRLAGGVAHDFNNILTVILGSSYLLETQIGEGSPLYEDVDQIRRSGERAAALTRQLLAFSRKQVLMPVVLDLNTVVSGMEKMLRRVIGEDVELAVSLLPELGRVKADPGQVEQVIVNLAVNSRDAMPRGGRLMIETRNIEIGESHVRDGVTMRAGPHVMLSVSDTGMGMDAETVSHIFEPFFTTKETGKGTGLGLATVYGIVKQSGGYIWVDSEPGKGATFRVYLPRVDAREAAASERRSEADEFRGTETVLLVEDEPNVRRLAARTLETHGYSVLVASNGAAALDLAAKHNGTIHMLLTDVVMPGMSGPDVARQLAQARQGTKVLLMSGYTDDAVVRHGVLDGGPTLIQKPFSPRTLLEKVRTILDTKPV